MAVAGIKVARTYDAGMTSPATISDRPVPPRPTCAPAYVGPCTKCQHPTHRYGPGGNPLCRVCYAELEEWRAKR